MDREELRAAVNDPTFARHHLCRSTFRAGQMWAILGPRYPLSHYLPLTFPPAVLLFWCSSAVLRRPPESKPHPICASLLHCVCKMMRVSTGDPKIWGFLC